MISRRLRMLITALAAVAATACVVETEDADSSDQAVSSVQPMKLLTFNAGLVRGGVALVDERLPKIAPALQATGADVLCLQEVWADQDYASIEASLASTHPHAFHKVTEENGSRWFSCNPFRLMSLKSCVDSQCTPNGVSSEECVQNPCVEQYGALSDRCKLCLASNTDSPMGCLMRAEEFVQGGRNGLALFSKFPIENARFEDYGSALVHRGFIRATIQGKEIVCTHLSSNLKTVPYPKDQPWSSWAEEQASEPATVAAALPSDGCRLVMGDLNASLETGEVKAEVPSTIEALAQKGFREPWSSAKCTWCPPPANPLASGEAPKLYDHILVAGCESATYERVMDQPIDVVHEGKPLTTRLSDHFGLMATVR